MTNATLNFQAASGRQILAAAGKKYLRRWKGNTNNYFDGQFSAWRTV